MYPLGRLAPDQEVTHVEAAQPLRVLIAENHRDLSDVMRELINAEPDMECVGQVTLAAEVLPLAASVKADALILDLSLQGGSALPLLEQLKTHLPGLRVIVFSGVAYAEEVAREAIRRGADAFVPKGKGADFEALLAALRQR